ncbi:hypothetical protein KAT80_03520 [Candidatus Pacearchaeota archaeon]|nr:hypothetical protein [Candidatus Pacearchaeota archaeon]
MEINLEKKEIILNKNINELDKFVLDFCRNFDNYVLVSGYVSILFGRSRATEDVDLLIPKMPLEKFKEIWDIIKEKDFECINTLNVEDAFKMLDEYAIRFCRKGKPVPNMEFKRSSNEIHEYSLKNKIKVKIKDGFLFISPIEMQIAYKLMLGKGGNEKDLEDAKHLYELFKENINKEELFNLINEFGVEEQFEIIK